MESARADDHLESHISRALDASYHDGAGGWDSTGVRWWIRFHVARGEDPFTFAGHDAPLPAKLEDERRLMRFAVWLVESKSPGVAVDTASGYTSTVQGWLARNFGVKLASGLEMFRLRNMLKGLHRLHGGRPRRKLRKAITPQKLSQLMVMLNPEDPQDANFRAAFACMLQGLLRGGEAGLSGRHKWTPEGKTCRSDFVFSSRGVEFLIAPLKNAETLGAKNLPILIGRGGSYVDAVVELENLLRVDQAAGDAPAFRDVRTGRCLSVDAIHKKLQSLVARVGMVANEYGSHSLRIGGATAMFAAGSSPLDIRTLGRWDSEIYRIYVHCDRGRAFANSARLASQFCDPQEDAYDEVDFY